MVEAVHDRILMDGSSGLARSKGYSSRRALRLTIREARCLWFPELNLGVEEFGEAGVVGHVLEVGVGAGLDAVSGVVVDGLGEVVETASGVAGHAGQDGEAVESVVGGGVGGEDGVEVLARVFVVTVVEERDGVVVLLFVAVERGLAFGDLADAGVDVHADAVAKVAWAGKEHLVEGSVGLIVFALLHELEGGLVIGDHLGSTVVLRSYDAGEGAGGALG
jgi:hypothetical protein